MKELFMALGRRNELQQGELFIAADNLPTSDDRHFASRIKADHVVSKTPHFQKVFRN